MCALAYVIFFLYLCTLFVYYADYVMKKTWLILLFAFALCACKHTQQETHVSDIFLNAQYGDTHAISEWAGRHWEIFGNANTPENEKTQPYKLNISWLSN